MALNEADVLVAGGGIAALTAGLFAARNGRRRVVLTGGPAAGGSLLTVGRIEDIPGFPDGVPGYDLCPIVQEQAAEAGAEFSMALIEGLEAVSDRWRAATAEGDVLATTVILATGSRPKRLGVRGEVRLAGMGVTTCATCDGPLFHGRTVGVIGGGDSALLEALELAEHVAKVMVFHRGDRLEGQRTHVDRVLAHPAIEVHYGSIVEEIIGDERVSGLRVRDGEGADTKHDLSAVFVYVGLQPNTEFWAGLLSLDPLGRIPTDGLLRTELPGVFAAGDIRSDSVAQAVAAAGDGATAAMAAERYLVDGAWRSAKLAIEVADQDR